MKPPPLNKSTALLSKPTSCQLVDLLILPLGNVALCFHEDVPSTFLEFNNSNYVTVEDGHIDDQIQAAYSCNDTSVPSGCSTKYSILSTGPDQMDANQTNECIQFLSHAITRSISNQCNINYAQSHQIPNKDIQNLHHIVSQLLMLDSTIFSYSRRHHYDCPCKREGCRVNEILNALGCQLDMEEYDACYTKVICNKRQDREKIKQLRVYLTMNVDFMQQNKSSTVTTNFISKHIQGSITILPRSIQPLISISLSPIIDDLNPNVNVMTNPLLRSCVKRLLVGRRVLHSQSETETCISRESGMKTILSVAVPSHTNDTTEKISLSYEVTSIQPRSNSSLHWLTQFIILPSTRIIFQPQSVKKSQNTKQNQKSLNAPSISSETTQQHVNIKAIPPHQHLIESLQSILMFNSSNNSTSHPPTLRSFLFSGPPGVGKTYAVKQAISIANSWFNSANSRQKKNEAVQLVSIRGSELLASAADGQHAGAAKELERQFRRAVDMCHRNANSNGNYSNINDATLHSDNGTKAVIIFLDECDALVSSSTVVAAMLAMLLDLMESMDSSGWDKLLVVAATNRVDAIPTFLRRPGRLEKEVVVSPPDAEERFLLLKDMLELGSGPAQNLGEDGKDTGLTVDVSDGDLRGLAEMCVGYVAADVAALVRRASVLSMERVFHNNPETNARVQMSSSISISDLINATNDVGASCLRDASLSAPPKTTWDDIAGDVGGAKQALRQAIEWPRTRKAAFKALGLTPPRGILLHGPPGCAKTTLARAAAGSAGVAFLSLSPADVYSSSYVGEAESVVRRAFDLARAATPCVLFFDEIDSIIGGDDDSSGNHGHGMGRGSSAEARVLSTFLNEMDGVDGSVEDGVLVLGATNRPRTLDAALLRPGRFDRVIYVPPPDECGRKDILRMECSKWKDSIFSSNDNDSNSLEDNLNLNFLATDEITGLMTGAEIVGACREAAVNVMRSFLISRSYSADKKMPLDLPIHLMQALKTELESTLRNNQPLLSDSYVLEEYTRFEAEHK